MLESPAYTPQQQAPVVVFLHGSGTGPRIWESVRALLGWPSVALEVPSNLPDMDPERGAAALLADPSFPAQGPVVLVLHSLAGVLESALGGALGSRLRHVVHLAAVVPAPGKSFAQTMGIASRLILPVLFATHPRGLAPSPAMIQSQMGNDLSMEQCANLVARFRPERGGFFLRPVTKQMLAVDRTYVVCTQDRSVPPTLQRRIANRLGAQVAELPCGHMPMLSQPHALSNLLSRCLAGLERSPARTTSQAPVG